MRNNSIDWMRTVGIAFITGFWHLTDYSSVFKAQSVPFADAATVVALGLLTLLSGFLIGKSEPPPDLRAAMRFLGRRMVRIYPPYVVALLVFTMMGISTVSVSRAALLVSMVDPPAPPTLWFVTMIALFYLVLPLLSAILDRLGLAVGCTIAIWMLVGVCWRLTGAVDPRLLLYWPPFVAGMILGRHPKMIRQVPKTIVWLALIASWLFASHKGGTMHATSIYAAPMALAGPIAIFLTAFGRLPSNGLVEQFSFGSYFLYLFHRPIYVAMLTLSGLPDTVARLIFLALICFPTAVIVGIGAQMAYDCGVASLRLRTERSADAARRLR